MESRPSVISPAAHRTWYWVAPRSQSWLERPTPLRIPRRRRAAAAPLREPMDPAYTREYEQFELRHWWHIPRRRLIESMIDGFVPAPQASRWLDIGCGTGVLLNSYEKIATKLGLEWDGHCVSRGRGKGLDIRQSRGCWDLSRYGHFDLITVCDVIEHVEDDRHATAAMYDALKPGGVLLVTVPALMSLWSGHDIINHHFRRYRRRSLLDLFPAETWDVLQVSYFSMFLLPLIWLTRKIKNLRGGLRPELAHHDLKFGPRWMDAALQAIFACELFVLIKCCNLPIGSSLILVARKR